VADDLFLRVDDAAVRAALERLRGAPRERLPQALREAGRMLKTSTQLRFRTQTAPDGTAWEKSAAAIARRGQTLRDTSRLRNSITWQLTGTGVSVGTNVVYAAIHQFGGPTGRASSSRGPVRRPVLPPRPFLGASPDDLRALAALLERHVREAFGDP
jgi:phage virion morphogenesis protein